METSGDGLSFALGWTWGRRACGRPWSTCKAAPSPSASRRSRRPIHSRPGPSSSRLRGGQRRRRRSALPWPRDTRRRAGHRHRPRLHGLHRRGLDCDGEPLRPALLWMDQRAFREADEISATGDPVLRFVSGRVSPEWMLPKALWLKRNEPEVYARARRIVECTDWMMFRLTGEWTLSLNHVAVKWNYARPDGGWPVGLLEAVGLADLLGKWPERIVPLGVERRTLEQDEPQASWGCEPGFPLPKGGSTPTWACSAWGRRATATSR